MTRATFCFDTAFGELGLSEPNTPPQARRGIAFIRLLVGLTEQCSVKTPNSEEQEGRRYSVPLL